MNKHSLSKLMCLLVLQITLAEAQINPLTNAAYEPDEPSVPSTSTLKTLDEGIPCGPGTFFAVTSTSKIIEFNLTGTVATQLNATHPLAYTSLAFCDNILGGTLTPTFFSQINNGSFYDGTGWQNAAVVGSLFNYGGSGSNLYMHNASQGFKVVKYNGTQLITIYDNPNKSAGVGDLAVDPQGNVIFMSCENKITSFTDSLYVMSPSGQLLKQIPFVMDFYHAYGSFFMNGIYYVGLGSANPLFPQTLLPITIGTSTVTLGTPISMPPGNYYDLANCASASDYSGVKTETQTGAFMYPNPVVDELRLQFSSFGPRTIRIADLNGRVCYTLDVTEKNNTIKLNQISTGIYVIEVIQRDKVPVVRQKLVVQ